jgi:PAS domain S-box-containing protein
MTSEVRTAFDHVPIGIFLIDAARRIVFWNACFEDWTGRPRAEALGRPLDEVFPAFAAARYAARLDKLFNDGLPLILSYQLNGDLYRRPGNDRIFHSTVTRIETAEGNRALFAVEDRTEIDQRIRTNRKEISRRAAAEARLQAALDDRDMLMREMNHRIKNNLMMVRSLISLQAERVDDPRLASLHQDLESRIGSIETLHELLYKAKLPSAVRLDDYLSMLGDKIIAGVQSAADGVELRYDFAPATIRSGRAVYVGLLFAELLTNALKYGRSADGALRIAAKLRVSGDRAELDFSDGGPGLPKGFDPAKAASLGLSLVATLAQQLRAVQRIESGPGLRIVTSIPLEDKDKAADEA